MNVRPARPVVVRELGVIDIRSGAQPVMSSREGNDVVRLDPFSGDCDPYRLGAALLDLARRADEKAYHLVRASDYCLRLALHEGSPGIPKSVSALRARAGQSALCAARLRQMAERLTGLRSR